MGGRAKVRAAVPEATEIAAAEARAVPSADQASLRRASGTNGRAFVEEGLQAASARQAIIDPRSGDARAAWPEPTGPAV